MGCRESLSPRSSGLRGRGRDGRSRRRSVAGPPAVDLAREVGRSAAAALRATNAPATNCGRPASAWIARACARTPSRWASRPTGSGAACRPRSAASCSSWRERTARRWPPRPSPRARAFARGDANALARPAPNAGLSRTDRLGGIRLASKPSACRTMRSCSRWCAVGIALARARLPRAADVRDADSAVPTARSPRGGGGSTATAPCSAAPPAPRRPRGVAGTRRRASRSASTGNG